MNENWMNSVSCVSNRDCLGLKVIHPIYPPKLT